MRYYLDFDPFDFDKFTLKTCDEHDNVYEGRLSEIASDGDDWQDALDKHFEQYLSIKPEDWVVG